MKTISIINLKGGVAKTITSVNMAHILSSVHGKRVLLIDNDKQGNTSKMFGYHDYDLKTIADVLTNKNLDIKEAIIPTNYENIHVIPANMNLLKANLEILMDMSRQQTRLERAIKPVLDEYDYCIIDNAPDINMAVINALVITDDVIVPIKVDKYAFDGLEILLEQIEEVKEFNPDIRFTGCLITMFQKNTVNVQGEAWLKSQSQYPTFESMIRRTTKVDETTFTGESLIKYAPKCTAARDYLSFVDEYLRKKQ
jgi:chromosome partitioning protein